MLLPIIERFDSYFKHRSSRDVARVVIAHCTYMPFTLEGTYDKNCLYIIKKSH